eukprot:snap_masked-scaffold_4-processed-gene-18.38-mRNA-1 protein AED:0.03 eAED:0.03 QI:0/-1/0/1/-1/1/1/0/274
MQEFLSGGLAGGCGLITVHPIDTIRIRLQNSSGSSLKTTLSREVARLLKHEGTKGLFKGVASPLVTCSFMNSILFFTYETSLSLISSEPIPSLLTIYVAGSIGGLASGIMNSPTELIKIKAQVNTTRVSNQLQQELHIFKNLLRSKSVFRGTFITVLRDAPSCGLYFAVYEFWIRTFGSDRFQQLLAGGVTGALSWSSVYPLDVIKTRWQSSQTTKNIFQLTKDMYTNEGISVFFKGYGATMLKAVPQSAVIFLTYSEIQSFLDRLDSHRVLTV